MKKEDLKIVSGGPKLDWKSQTVLVTGATGSFGQKFIRIIQEEMKPKRIIVFSRDELKQHEMRIAGCDHPNLRYFIGDIRDKERLARAVSGVDTIIHAAALKQVSACEYNPIEAIQTNIIGARNLIDVSIDAGVKRVIALSTDKAVNPINLYGATKLCAEKLFIQGNFYAGAKGTHFSCVRYGNVVGSRGSVIPVFLSQRKTGVLQVTDERMTRFWITLEQGARFVIKCANIMEGGEVFIPKIPSTSIMDLAKVIAPECSIKIVGIRPGEKLHEVLISEDESRLTVEHPELYVISTKQFNNSRSQDSRRMVEGFRYASNTNSWKLTSDQLRDLIGATLSFDGHQLATPALQVHLT